MKIIAIDNRARLPTREAALFLSGVPLPAQVEKKQRWFTALVPTRLFLARLLSVLFFCHPCFLGVLLCLLSLCPSSVPIRYQSQASIAGCFWDSLRTAYQLRTESVSNDRAPWGALRRKFR